MTLSEETRRGKNEYSWPQRIIYIRLRLSVDALINTEQMVWFAIKYETGKARLQEDLGHHEDLSSNTFFFLSTFRNLFNFF